MFKIEFPHIICERDKKIPLLSVLPSNKKKYKRIFSCLFLYFSVSIFSHLNAMQCERWS